MTRLWVWPLPADCVLSQAGALGLQCWPLTQLEEGHRSTSDGDLQSHPNMPRASDGEGSLAWHSLHSSPSPTPGHLDQWRDHTLPSCQPHWQILQFPPGLGTCSFYHSALTAIEGGVSLARGRRQEGSLHPQFSFWQVSLQGLAISWVLLVLLWKWRKIVWGWIKRS